MMEWEQEFLRLYMSCDLDKSRDAFKLKRKHLPPKLFRYRNVCCDNLILRKREIGKGEIFLSHPQKLNDPFECWSFLHSKSPLDYVDKSMYIDYYVRTGKTKELEVILQNNNWFEALITLQTSQASSEQEAEKIKLAIEDSVMLSMEEFNKVIRDKIMNMVRFACFSTTPTNLPMWYHYTNKRSGICLEYSTADITEHYQLNSLFPVQYVDQLPDMTYMLAHKNKVGLSMPTYLSFHKLKDWAYEHEWRLIYDTGYWMRKGESLPNDFENGVALKFVKPSKVILGTDIAPEFEKELRDCAIEHGIAVVKSKLTEYGLAIE